MKKQYNSCGCTHTHTHTRVHLSNQNGAKEEVKSTIESSFTSRDCK